MSREIQSRYLILSERLTSLINKILDETNQRNINLHFVMERETYNIIKAAEERFTGVQKNTVITLLRDL